MTSFSMEPFVSFYFRFEGIRIPIQDPINSSLPLLVLVQVGTVQALALWTT